MTLIKGHGEKPATGKTSPRLCKDPVDSNPSLHPTIEPQGRQPASKPFSYYMQKQPIPGGKAVGGNFFNSQD